MPDSAKNLYLSINFSFFEMLLWWNLHCLIWCCTRYPSTFRLPFYFGQLTRVTLLTHQSHVRQELDLVSFCLDTYYHLLLGIYSTGSGPRTKVHIADSDGWSVVQYGLCYIKRPLRIYVVRNRRWPKQVWRIWRAGLSSQ